MLTRYAFADACRLYLPLIPLVPIVGADAAASRGLRMWGTRAVYRIALVHTARGFFDRQVKTLARSLVAVGITIVIFTMLDSAGPIVYVRLTAPR